MRGLSCNSGPLSMFTVEKAISVVADLGYQAIDISLEVSPPFLPSPEPHMSPDADANTRGRVLRAAAQAGVEIAALNAHTSLIHAVPEIRQANFEFVRGSLQLASDLGASCVITGSGRKDFYGQESQYWSWLVDGLRELVVEANTLGVALAIEAGGLPGVLVHNLSRMQKLMGYEGLEALKVLYDPSHYHIRGDDPIDAYRALRERVVHMHVKDAKGDMEDFVFPPLGMGDVDFDGLLGAMADASYSGYISVEYEAFAWGYEADPRKALLESKAFLDPIIASKMPPLSVG